MEQEVLAYSRLSLADAEKRGIYICVWVRERDRERRLGVSQGECCLPFGSSTRAGCQRNRCIASEEEGREESAQAGVDGSGNLKKKESALVKRRKLK